MCVGGGVLLLLLSDTGDRTWFMHATQLHHGIRSYCYMVQALPDHLLLHVDTVATHQWHGLRDLAQLNPLGWEVSGPPLVGYTTLHRMTANMHTRQQKPQYQHVCNQATTSTQW